MFQYDAAWPVYALDWCKQPTQSSNNGRPNVRLAAGSLSDDYRNQIVVLGPSDERILIEDDADGSEELVELAVATHGYPATSLQWQPASGAGAGWTNKGTHSDVLASTGDILRVWSFGADAGGAGSGYVGRGAPVQYSLTARHQLSGTKSTNGIYAPLTSFSWNTPNPARIVTASVDTTCTVWDIEAAQAVTQLIAHDRAVYDVAWLPTSTDIFVSVGADGSLRAFDLRSLEHSTILYETPAPKSSTGGSASGSPAATSRAGTSPLLRICFHPTDNNYMATFHLDGHDVQILDMRSPGSPVIELRGHRAQVNAIAFGAGDQPLLATAGDDCQVLLWDLAAYTSGKAPPTSSRHGSSPRPDSTKKRVVTEPVMAYTGPGEMTSLAWAPPRTASGEWLAMATGRTVKVLKV